MARKIPLPFKKFVEIYILDEEEVINIKKAASMGDRRFDGCWWWNDLDYLVVEPQFWIH